MVTRGFEIYGDVLGTLTSMYEKNEEEEKGGGDDSSVHQREEGGSQQPRVRVNKKMEQYLWDNMGKYTLIVTSKKQSDRDKSNDDWETFRNEFNSTFGVNVALASFKKKVNGVKMRIGRGEAHPQDSSRNDNEESTVEKPDSRNSNGDKGLSHSSPIVSEPSFTKTNNNSTEKRVLPEEDKSSNNMKIEKKFKLIEKNRQEEQQESPQPTPTIAPASTAVPIAVYYPTPNPSAARPIPSLPDLYRMIPALRVEQSQTNEQIQRLSSLVVNLTKALLGTEVVMCVVCENSFLITEMRNSKVCYICKKYKSSS